MKRIESLTENCFHAIFFSWYRDNAIFFQPQDFYLDALFFFLAARVPTARKKFLCKKSSWGKKNVLFCCYIKNTSTPLCDNGGSFWKVGIMADLFARVAIIFQGLWTFLELVSALMVLGWNFDLGKKNFYQRTQNNDKTCKFKERKKAIQILSKKSAVITQRCRHFLDSRKKSL